MFTGLTLPGKEKRQYILAHFVELLKYGIVLYALCPIPNKALPVTRPPFLHTLHANCKEFQVNSNFELPCFSNDLQINVRRNTYFCLVAPLKTKFLPQISCEDKKLLQIMCYTQTDALKQKVKTEG